MCMVEKDAKTEQKDVVMSGRAWICHEVHAPLSEELRFISGFG